MDGADAPRGPLLRNWRVPTRLTVLILTPTVVGVVLAGTRVLSSIDTLAAHRRTHAAIALSAQTRDLAEALGMERDRTIWVRVTGRDRDALTAQRRAVDALVPRLRAGLDAVDAAYGPDVAAEARQVAGRLGDLASLRRTGRPDEYGRLVAVLLAFHDELTQTGEDRRIAAASRALGALAHAKEEVSRQRATLLGVLPRGRRLTADELEELIAARARQRARIAAFHADAGPQDAWHLAVTVSGPRVIRAELTKSWAIALAGRDRPPAPAGDRVAAARQWFADNTETVERMRAVELRLAAAVEARARALREDEQRGAWIGAGLILLLLLLVLATTVAIARSMVRPLRRLRAEALAIAGHRLPEVVQRLREEDVPRIPRPTPIDLVGRDEIGEVARAFDEVHRQAVRLAAEEARLRANISAMFVNLSRRTQTLVERQIDLIDRLERGEEDGARLGDLFKLDHLATRMRRNSENLLVLAGHEPARRRSRPAPLIDVVRAAVSEVEDYERVSIQVQRDVSVAGHAANDVVHLVAELVENALTFSPRPSKVVVSSSVFDGDSALLAIGDTGIGMPPEQMAEANRRLADPPEIDVSVSRRMGLFVVGRLALRHGIRVQLRPGQDSGVIAMVLFPAGLVVRPRPRPEPPVSGTGVLPPTGPFPAFAGHPAGPYLWNAPVPEDADPLPAVAESPLEHGDDYLPIYASIGSAGPRPAEPRHAAEPSGESPSRSPSATPPWSPSGQDRPGGGGPPGPKAAWDPEAYGMPVIHPPIPRQSPPRDAEPPRAHPGRPPGDGPRDSSDDPRDARTDGPTDGTRTPREGHPEDPGEAAARGNQPPGENFTPAGLPKRQPRVPREETTPAAGTSAPPPSPEETRDRLARLQEGTRRGRAEVAGDPVERSDHEEEEDQ
ncbi:nitrate- and nitrite sensing domain-containing protein [Thermopolyspora sp. NPDC052614]|uniref:nitrate- and nitrite sensing domain-containing protein n=1 Tax=Thermopolyspora sp. NPDC052614 TaxID=3155682 RepID=UPI00344974C9